MTTANETRGEIALVLDGQEFVMRPTYQAIQAFESATGRSLVELAREALEGRLSTGDAAIVATHCIRAWGETTGSVQARAAKVERIGELIVEAEGGMTKALGMIGGMLALAATGNYTAKGEPKAAATETTDTSSIPAAA